MASWQKSDPALIERFLASLPLTHGVERRQMFGYPCAFINGNMFAGLHEQRLIVRLPAEAAARPFAVMGKVRKDYAAIPDALDCPPQQFREWISSALDYAKALPPKERKAKAKAAGTAKAAATKAKPVVKTKTKSAATKQAKPVAKTKVKPAVTAKARPAAKTKTR